MEQLRALLYRMAPCDYSPLANDLAELEINVKSKSAVLIS